MNIAALFPWGPKVSGEERFLISRGRAQGDSFIPLQVPRQLRKRAAAGARSFAALILTLALASCISNGKSKRATGLATLNGPTPSPSSSLPGFQGYGIQITTLSIIPGGAEVKLVGSLQKTNGMPYCTVDSTAGSNTPGLGVSTCACLFTYGLPGLNGQLAYTSAISQTTSYGNDFVRCALAGMIPTDARNVTVQVQVKPSGPYSNPLLYSSQPDTSLYSKVQRFQCREYIKIPYIFGGDMYDPFQSEDPDITFGFDLYTTNPGKTLIELASNSGSTTQFYHNWECVLNPEDRPPSLRPKWLNLVVYSLAPDSQGNRFISDFSGTPSNRNSFFVSKQQTPLFNAPVKSMMMPGKSSGMTLPNGDVLPPMGYAARPDRSTGACPATIPAGFQWRKLLLYRSDVPIRQYVKRGEWANNLSHVGCHPGTLGAGQGINDCPRNGSNPIRQRIIEELQSEITVCLNNPADHMDLSTGGPVPWDKWTRTAVGSVIPPVDWAISDGKIIATNPTPQPYTPSMTVHTDKGQIQSAATSDYIFVVAPPDLAKTCGENQPPDDGRTNCSGDNPAYNYDTYRPRRFPALSQCATRTVDGDGKITYAPMAAACPEGKTLPGFSPTHYMGRVTSPSADPSQWDYPLCVLQETAITTGGGI